MKLYENSEALSNRTRRPTMLDRLRGCLDWSTELLYSLLSGDLAAVRFDAVMFWETLKGNFEVVEDE